jgi:hypothetical protein
MNYAGVRLILARTQNSPGQGALRRKTQSTVYNSIDWQCATSPLGELSDHSGENLTYLVVEIQPRYLVFYGGRSFLGGLRGFFLR